jgi:CubicO group peptidase (beta-lactamase class C family)
MSARPATGAAGLIERAEQTLEEFRRVAAEYGVRGAVLSVLARNEARHVVGGGDATGEPALGIESQCPMGSITKPVTATVLMRLVDRGIVDLDRPAGEYVPEFTISDPDAAKLMTVRRLLSHTAGLYDSIEGKDERELSALADSARAADFSALGRALESFMTPGEIYSYSSVGYIVLGRLVELVTAKSWSEALADELLTPLALAGTSCTGHGGEGFEGAGSCLPLTWLGPASQLSSTPADLLAFARLHMEQREPELQQLLSAEAVAEMRRPVAPVPNRGVAAATGLGWRIVTPGAEVIGHWGLSPGHAVGLWLMPLEGAAVALTVRHDHAQTAEWLLLDVYGRVFEPFLPSGWATGRPRDQTEPSPGIDGTYEVPGFRFRVHRNGGRPTLVCEQIGVIPSTFTPLAGKVFTLSPTESPTEVIARGQDFSRTLVQFCSPDARGRCKYLHVWSQSAVRVD